MKEKGDALRVEGAIQEQEGLKRAPTQAEVELFLTKHTAVWNAEEQEFKMALLLHSDWVEDIDIGLLKQALADILDSKKAPTILLFPGNVVV